MDNTQQFAQPKKSAILKRNVNTSAILLAWEVLLILFYLYIGQTLTTTEISEGGRGVLPFGSIVLGGISFLLGLIIVASCFVGLLMGSKRAIQHKHNAGDLILNLLLVIVSISGFIAFYLDYLS